MTENELLAACVGPDLDNITATAVLSELRNTCLYLHYDGVRYCFKKDPNVTKLIEDAEQTVAREDSQARGHGPVRSQIKEMLEARLAGHHTAIVWPAKSQDIPDQDPRFLVAYLPLEFAAGSAERWRRRGQRSKIDKSGPIIQHADQGHLTIELSGWVSALSGRIDSFPAGGWPRLNDQWIKEE